MTRIYWIKRNIPLAVRMFMRRYENYYKHKDISFDVYSYKGSRGKTYGLQIYWDGVFADNHYQGTVDDFLTWQPGDMERA